MYIHITTLSKINSKYIYSTIGYNSISSIKIHTLSSLGRHYIMSSIYKINICSMASYYI